MVRIRRAFMDTMMSIAALTVLFGILTAVNADLRHQISRRFESGEAISTMVSTTRNATTGVVRAARFQTIGYASLVLFVCAAGVLVLFMLRM